MPNVNDIANIAQALEKAPLIMAQDRCLAVRNRNSTCRACMRACPFGAVKVEANELMLDPAACVGCGACVSACPTQAIAVREPSDPAVVLACDSMMQLSEGLAVIACARISSKKQADPARYIELACLARVDEALLLELAAMGASEIVLVDGNCETCKYGVCMAAVDETVDQANALLECQGSSVRARRQTAFPEELVEEGASEKFGSTRRGFFSEAATAARETALTAARTTIESELGIKEPEVAIGERLRVDETGALPRIEIPRHTRLLNAFDALGAPTGDRIESRRLGTVRIDSLRCNACGMCAVFCPTGALSRCLGDKPSNPLTELEFTAADCVNCRLCRDVCWKGALEIEEGVSVEQLFDFEPVVFKLKPAGSKLGFGY